MTVNNLIRIFQANKVPEHFYTIGGLGGGECYGIEFAGGEWRVYYSERGRKTVLQTSNTEEAACLELIRYIDEMMQDDFGYSLDLSK